jgi:hypothetical protein
MKAVVTQRNHLLPICVLSFRADHDRPRPATGRRIARFIQAPPLLAILAAPAVAAVENVCVVEES